MSNTDDILGDMFLEEKTPTEEDIHVSEFTFAFELLDLLVVVWSHNTAGEF